MWLKNVKNHQKSPTAIFQPNFMQIYGLFFQCYLVQTSFIPRKNLRHVEFPLNVNLIFRRTKIPRHMSDLSFVSRRDQKSQVIFTISQFASLSLFVHIIMMINFMQQFTSKDRLLFKKRLTRIFLYQRVITHAWLIFRLNYLRLLLRTTFGRNN